ncbi:MAG: M64 family metallopeptidase, partial [Pseudomonadota bacterium]
MKRTAVAPRVGLAFVIVAAVAFPQSTTAFTVETVLDNGPSSNRFDLVLVGDGFTAGQQGGLTTAANDFAASFFLEEPFKTYKTFYNVHVVHVVSNETGADKQDAVTDGDCPTATFVADTYLDGTFCTSNMQRLLTANPGKLYEVLDRDFPDWDKAMVIVNSTRYGGSGGLVPVTSLHSTWIEGATHELGHTLGSLADEYESCYPSFPQGANTYNITVETSRDRIPWKDWIDPAMPVPTSYHENCNGIAKGSCGSTSYNSQTYYCDTASGAPQTYFDLYSSSIGTWEGGRYLHTDNFRPTINCMMRSLSQPFCPICRERMILSTYGEVDHVDSYDPGVQYVDANREDVQTFSLVAIPKAGSGYAIEWRVDGAASASAGSTFALVAANYSNGLHTVTVQSHDETLMVRTDPSTLLTETRTWTVFVCPADKCCVGGIVFSDGDADPTNSCRSCHPEIARDVLTDDDTIPCDDGNACSHSDTCAAGACAGTSYSCDDANMCTDDACLGDGTCANTDNTAACDDGNACSHSDTCAAGA